VVDTRLKYEIEKAKSSINEMNEVKTHLKNEISQKTMEHINSEKIIDNIVNRTKRKQLNG